MTELKTSDALLRKLREATARTLTAEELRKQRVSYIMSMMKDMSGMTRERVQRILAEQEGKKAS